MKIIRIILASINGGLAFSLLVSVAKHAADHVSGVPYVASPDVSEPATLGRFMVFLVALFIANAVVFAVERESR